METSLARTLPAVLLTRTDGPTEAPSKAILSAPAVIRHCRAAGLAAFAETRSAVMEKPLGCSPQKNHSASCGCRSWCVQFSDGAAAGAAGAGTGAPGAGAGASGAAAGAVGAGAGAGAAASGGCPPALGPAPAAASASSRQLGQEPPQKQPPPLSSRCT